MKTTLVRSRRRTISIQVKNGELIVRAPLYTGRREIEAFVSGHRDWIEKQLRREEERARELSLLPKYTEEELKAISKKARKVIPKRVAFYAAAMGVTPGRLSFRFQHSRWGSCNMKGDLSFNCLLAEAPAEVLDSVVVHELAHIRELNHSARFYAEVLRVYPEYRKWNAWLKKQGGLLIGRLP